MKDVVKKVLKNGVTCYLYSDENLKRFAVSYGVNYGLLGYFDKFYYDGKKYEVPPAVAHFIEHTLIEKSKYGNLLFELKDRNYMMNGATSFECTRYYFVGIKEPYDSIKKLINIVDDPVFTKEDIDEARHAIVEEALKWEDNKYGMGSNLNMRALYNNFEAVYESGNVLGSKETTEAITYEDVRVCYDAYYSDDNKVLAIAGNFEIDEMVTFLEGVYSEIPSHPNKRKPYDYGNEFKVRTKMAKIRKPVSNDYILASFKMKNDFGIDKMALNYYIHMYLKQKVASDTQLVIDMQNDKIIIGGIGYSVYFFQEDVLSVTFTADVTDDVEFVKRLKNALNTEGLDERDFELYKRNMIVQDLSKMDYVYDAIIGFPANIEFSDKIYSVDKISECTFEEMKRVASKLDWTEEAITLIEKDEGK